jgi:pyruvate carboxylase
MHLVRHVFRKFIRHAKHIEVQLRAIRTVICAFHERDCSIQRRTRRSSRSRRPITSIRAPRRSLGAIASARKWAT